MRGGSRRGSGSTGGGGRRGGGSPKSRLLLTATHHGGRACCASGTARCFVLLPLAPPPPLPSLGEEAAVAGPFGLLGWCGVWCGCVTFGGPCFGLCESEYLGSDTVSPTWSRGVTGCDDEAARCLPAAPALGVAASGSTGSWWSLSSSRHALRGVDGPPAVRRGCSFLSVKNELRSTHGGLPDCAYILAMRTGLSRCFRKDGMRVARLPLALAIRARWLWHQQ